MKIQISKYDFGSHTCPCSDCLSLVHVPTVSHLSMFRLSLTCPCSDCLSLVHVPTVSHLSMFRLSHTCPCSDCLTLVHVPIVSVCETNHTLGNEHLIGDFQHGLRNKRSCLTSLPHFFAQVIDTYDTDNNKAVDLVDLDFQKAFDKVPHERLMLKVNAHGIQGDAARWI